MYEVGDDLLLMVASDRVSAFDVVLNEPIPRKGEVLTLLTAWWLHAIGDLVEHHLVAANPDDIADRVPVLRGIPDGWARRSLLVRRTLPIPVECVVRGYLSGSAWREYQERGTLAGEPLPSGLRESQELNPPIFSPATKADVGHDENISFSQMAERIGTRRAERLQALSLRLFDFGRKRAATRGILLADTKFEFGEVEDGRMVLIDEVLTPDSSRYWPEEEWVIGDTPPSLDKQPIRDWLDRLPDWDRSPPPPTLTAQVVEAASKRYLEVFRRLTGMELDDYSPPATAPPPAEGV